MSIYSVELKVNAVSEIEENLESFAFDGFDGESRHHSYDNLLKFISATG